MRSLLVAGFLASLATGAAIGGGCSSLGDDCADTATCEPTSCEELDRPELWDKYADQLGCTGGGGSGGGGTGGTTSGGGGAGGSDPCGGCTDPTPICDTGNGTCVACLGHGDCTDPAAAQCDAGSCVPCGDASHCEGTGVGICDNQVCVECTAGDDSACTGTATCDLVAGTCTGAEAGMVGNCEACTNDVQCEAGHACIPTDFQGNAHGHYCLKAEPGCTQPWVVTINSESINEPPAADYCGIEETLATCEAVLALLGNYHCSGTDEMCSPDGIAQEEATPGAVCQDLGFGLRCTYECAGPVQCPDVAPQNTCGGGPPDWCGG